MDNGIDTMQLQKINKFQRLLAMMLSLVIIFSLCGTELVPIALAAENTQQETPDETQTETREEIKARLMKQIRYEGWDPYSADMTLDEFYALMELFDEGKLPLDFAAYSGFGDSGMEGPSIEGEANVIPRNMFMFRGLPTENGDGSPFEYQNGDAPLPYDNDGVYGYPNYPEGLDPYGLGYQVPPTSWQGVSLGTKTQMVIAVEGQNDNDNSIAGNVVQSLFKDYQTNYGYYVRRVTAENNETTVLGAIKLGNDKVVYYYLTDEKQSTDVSTTMLADGKKFIVEYSPIEHTVEYEVHWEDLEGNDITNNPTDVNVLGTAMSDTWENIIFGTIHSDKTDGSAYSFTAYAPYGYMVEFYLVKTTDEENGSSTGEKTWGAPAVLLGTESITDTDGSTVAKGSFKELNSGWALGMEPDYYGADYNGDRDGATIRPSVNGPSTLTMSGNIYNNGVHHDRKIIAVVHKNPEPTFFVAPIKHGTNNVNGGGARGTSAVPSISAKDSSGKSVTIPYDYEDVYMSVMGKQSRYKDYVLQNTNTNNTTSGNVVPSNGSWNWDYASAPLAMTQNPTDGAYSYQWTWQSNSSSGGYTLDSLEVNGVAVMIPFYSKYEASSTDPAKHNRWYTEMILPDGAKLLVEHLMTFNGGQQHVYRFTITGARSNVTVSAMNLIQGTGAPEFVTYQLTGVTDGNGATAVEYYSKTGAWVSTLQGNINVNDATGINFSGDNDSYGASIRFKLADGYSSPYFLWEATKAGVIGNQASAERDAEGNVILSELNPVTSLDGFSGVMDSQHVYGPDGDGWYYVRVTTQDNYKIALLTIGAKQVRYVVRYIPGTIPESTRVPTGMPTFDHTGESDFEISSQYANQYDTKGGAYYDVTADNVIILPTATPSDPSSKYKFVDWVLTDAQGKPVTDKNNNKEFHYSVTHINLIDVVDYAVQNDDLGGAATDIYVLHLMPTWAKIQNPLRYNVALNWVDAQGDLHTEYFEGWEQVLTDWNLDTSGKLTVQVIQEATPFKDWIANHPTYTFWDEVNTNNALYEYYQNHPDDLNDPDFEKKAYDAMSAEMEKAIQTYLPSLTAQEMAAQYAKVLEALCTRDISGTDGNGNPVKNGVKNGIEDFWRLGSYAYQVFEDYATIVVWMREDKGGLVFRKDVQPESFLPDEEFYFTVSQVTINSDTPLSGTYKAYPEKVYDEKGNVRDRLDSDAWLVTFKNGNITEIVKNDGSHTSTTWFTLKNGEGIGLYVPAGTYSITETGSQSGLSYKTSVAYASSNGSGPKTGWVLPYDGRLVGSEKSVKQSNEVKQVTATVDFEIGEQNVVQTLTFTNSTLSLRINCEVLAPSGHNLWSYHFGYQLQFTLPAGETPPKDTNGHYYYNVTAYRKTVDDDGNIKYIATPGTLWMTSATSTVARALGNPISLYDAGDNVWYGVLDSNNSAFTLQDSDYYVVTLPVPSDPNSKVNYKASETRPTDQQQWHLDGELYDRHGDLEPGDQKVEIYVNTINDPSIYVTKTVMRSDGKQDNNSFTFTVKLSDTTYTDEHFTNGVATFTLKHGDSMYLPLKGISADGTVTYTVTEASNSDYTTTSTKASGTIIDGSMICVSFVNTLITPDPGYLVITETGGSPNESFLYKITDATGNELIVSVKGGGRTVVACPKGTYTIEEITDWAWRYEDGVCRQSNGKIATVTVTAANDTPEHAVHADFTNDRNDKMWLGGENSKDNRFAGSSSDEGKETNTHKQEIAMTDEKKKQNEGDDQ